LDLHSSPPATSIRIRRPFAHDADPVVREYRMQVWRFHRTHVAAYALTCAHRASTSGGRRSPLLVRAHNVARKAARIIGGRVAHQRLVGIVAGNARDPFISFLPALA